MGESGGPSFHRDSLIRRVGGEPAMWLGAQRALLLQIAHPKVAAAVDGHSGFREQPNRRLWSTADTMLLMVWGRPDESAAARARVHAIHDHINGELTDDAAPWHRGDSYTAHDPALLRWVWATLVDTSEMVYTTHVGPLSNADRDALYADWLLFATFFGIPVDDLPSDRHQFVAAYEHELTALTIGPTAQRVGEAILDPPLWWAPRALKRLGATVTAGLLPADLRVSYSVAWGPAEQKQYEQFRALLARRYRALPRARVQLPYLYLAARRAVTSTIATLDRLEPVPQAAAAWG